VVLEQTELSRVWWKVDPGFDEETPAPAPSPGAQDVRFEETRNFYFGEDGDWSI